MTREVENTEFGIESANIANDLRLRFHHNVHAVYLFDLHNCRISVEALPSNSYCSFTISPWLAQPRAQPIGRPWLHGSGLRQRDKDLPVRRPNVMASSIRDAF